MKLTKNLLVILILSVFMLSMMTATAYAISSVKTVDQKDTGTSLIESKEKTAKNKITWNCNGGKIGSKKTITSTVTRGSKIKRLATTPKRSGYVFKGWYTKKSGGKKISVNTKPTKSLTYFAQWTKAKTLNADEKKLVGMWTWENIFSSSSPRENYVFTDKGKFFFYYGHSMAGDVKTGDFKATSKKITFSNIKHTISGAKKDYPKTQTAEYKFEQSPISIGGYQKYLNIRSLYYGDLSYLPYTGYASFKKQ